MSAEAYLRAKANLDAAKKALIDTSILLNNVSHQLRRFPPAFSFTDTGIGLQSHGPQSMSARDFPDATQIQQQIADYQDARHKAIQAWGAVPDQQKPNLTAPTD